ncbi:uncharacterized protein YacL [Anaerobacterium chartisolvens]|uniref:Uncharacterized protein YacL n=1 Tax=Anaerobacterium chartisolvens TaxID=1297424 RepID=A0A369BBA6_9FIRM|nr:TRAM domain-containing protein [Anaerobacterium chartisolvens]RCX18812.1 uncharacterized protein YacL [Anaerobacterium chartisolvens]
MINNVLKGLFAVIGAVTGVTLTRTFFYMHNVKFHTELKAAVFCLVTIACAFLFYVTANQIIAFVLKALDKTEEVLQKMSLYELTVSSSGLIVGLIVANLISIPINKVDIIGLPISIIANVLFGGIGIWVAVGKRNETLHGNFKERIPLKQEDNIMYQSRLLDTSVIIDGRIVDICRSGFLDGDIIVPDFVLEELRHIADSSDSLKRNRGRRGLDVLNAMQKELPYPVRIENFQDTEGGEADDKLLRAAKKINAKILTNDYNLNKVANFHGVQVLNINELANAMKPIALPGEEMSIQVVKDGKESGQGIGYLDDGTMIVVEGGRRYMGETVSVIVTSVIQTAAGRMIFAKPKNTIERVI